MKIQFATIAQDFAYLKENDLHIPTETLRLKIERGEIFVIRIEGQTIGWLRYGYFWDLIPMMNLLSIKESYQRKGFGTKLIAFWERKMKERGYNQAMTSTLSDENAQHFYRKLGYKDAGSLLLPNEALEIIFIKTLP